MLVPLLVTRSKCDTLVGSGRYAGRGYEREEDVGRGGTLLVKGLKSMWRQAAPIVRNTLQGALRRIIMQVRLPVITSCPETMKQNLLPKGN